jgi:hypothetical protein
MQTTKERVDIAAIQQTLRDEGIEGWLFYYLIRLRRTSCACRNRISYREDGST